ncbi:sel1 repeat family protein [Massilia sp. CCM 8733]|uniref:Sel1 repeat family protein n=1 Tax=Massilia mucilaginosa TaxID=2609282 RepID=A0ABX0NP35_9BURK|nr:SEL1-like repeat protein [Massilia mucilaginosa]NHZ88582.1 sel1 repeat family protein [Massilia mucilaginosa]
MKKTLFCLALMLSGVAHADELADANALFAKKSYPQALQLYTKLANTGNAEAQLHMGEMYFYGEAGTVDLAKAEAWFKKAAAKGNKTAAASLEMMKKRDTRRAELDYWIGKYDGAELSAGQFRCPAPRIPAMSKQNDEIESVSAKVAAWQDCYNAFVRNLNESSPLTKRIPKDIADLLTKDETEQSRVHLEGVYAGIAENAKVSAKLVLADFGAWRSATDAYIKEHNRIVTDAAATAPRKGD